MKKQNRFIIVILLLLALAISMFAGCGSQTEANEQTNMQTETTETVASEPWISSIEDLSGKRIGVLTGSVNEQYLKEELPSANITYFNTISDMAMALAANKIEAYVEDEATQRFIVQEYTEFTTLGRLRDIDYATFFPKTEEGRQLRDEMNEFLSMLRRKGTMDSLDDIWFGEDESVKTVDLSTLTGENGTLKMGVSTSVGYPFVYVKDGVYVGYEVDIAKRFCEEYGYALEIVDCNFDGLLAAVSTGKCDFGASGVTVTEERAESVYFSDPTYYSGSSVVVRKADLVTSAEETPIVEAAADEEAQTESLAEYFAGQRIGVITGSVYDQLVATYLPESQAEYFNSASDMALALESGKVAAYCLDEPSASLIFQQYPEQAIYTILEDSSYAYIFSKVSDKSNKLCEQMNEYLAKIQNDGTLEQIKETWFGTDDSQKVVDYSGLTGQNGTLNFAICTDVGVPFAYMKNNEYAGYDVDIAVRFCRAYGYDINIVDSYLSGFLASVTTGKCDFGASSVAITEERKQSMLFSDPNYVGGIALITAASEVSKTEDETVSGEVSGYEALRGKKIGVVTGMICDVIAEELIPECQVEYYTSNADLALALETGKVDSYMCDEPISRLLLNEYPNQVVYQTISTDTYGYIFRKNNEESDALRLQMNEFLQKIWADGTLRELDEIWFGQDETKKVVDYSGLTGENGTLRFATASTTGEPFCYLKNDQYAGYDIDIVVRFCTEYGYDLKIVDSDFNGMLANVAFGKCNFGGSCITITEERKEAVNFSDPNYTGGLVLVVKNSEATVEKTLEVSDSSVYEELRGSKIAVLTGTVFYQRVSELVPECEPVLYNSNADLGIALDANKVDAYMCDEPMARMMINKYGNQEIFAVAQAENYAFIFQKDSERSDTLRKQMNEFLQRLRYTGTMEYLQNIWLGTDETKKIVNFDNLTGENGTLYYASSSSVGMPFCYMKDGQYAGYEVDIMVRFCREYGYSFELVDSDFSGILANVSSRKCDIGGGALSITDERKETLNFSNSEYEGGTVIVTKIASQDDGSEEGFFESIKSSFTKTFLRENRWQLFVSGIGVTILITVIAAVCGTILAFGLFLLYRKNYAVAKIGVDVMSDILQKTPVVVILMILYYIIFGQLSLDSMWVSCIGFTLIFTGSVIGLLKVAVGAIDGGQMEAALALGYTDTHAFLRVILPQAMEHFLPNYRSELVALIKGTAVVGYIAVQDLTKISDIVRSRTYEAFFPLIATAIIYYALAWVLTLIVKRIQFRMNPKHRSKETVLKGVQTK